MIGIEYYMNMWRTNVESKEHQANKIKFEEKTIKDQAKAIAEQTKRIAELQKGKKT